MRLVVSRALDPALRRDLETAADVAELPFVRGRTVMPDRLGDDDVLIAGHPNYLGVFDEPEIPWIAVTGRWSSLRPIEGAAAEIVLGTPLPPAEADRSLQAVRELGRRVAQLANVTVAFPPESPVLILLLPVDPVAVVAAMNLPGCSALEGFGELPGGIRIEPDPPEPDGSYERYAAALEEVSREWNRPPAP